MSPFFPLGISHVGHASKSSLLGHVIIPYFIDQACSFKMAEYWPHSVLHFYGPRPGCALWPVAPASVTFVLGRLENLCFFTEIILLGTLDFTSSECWDAFNFSQSTALQRKAGLIFESVSGQDKANPVF